MTTTTTSEPEPEPQHEHEPEQEHEIETDPTDPTDPLGNRCCYCQMPCSWDSQAHSACVKEQMFRSPSPSSSPPRSR